VEGCIVRISKEKLLTEAEKTNFRADVLEKVAHLLNLLNALRSHPFLKDKLALKGGTALNLFFFNIPRLSVDIDLNYIGTEDKNGIIKIRPKIDQALRAVFSREGFAIREIPSGHAGGKWLLQYQSSSGQTGNLEVDINFMFRIPLWPVVQMNSNMLGSWQAENIALMDIHEIAAGKLAALLSRRQARDLFDSHKLLQDGKLDKNKLRIAFIVYGAMNRKDWRLVSPEDIVSDSDELARQLTPTLNRGFTENIAEYGRKLADECRQLLSAVFPLKKAEMDFLNLLLEEGRIRAELLTNDPVVCENINEHPMLKWKALNVRHYRGA
jgi:hypothetical protein